MRALPGWACAAVGVALLAYQGHALLLESHGPPGTPQGDVRLVGELAAPTGVEQSLRMGADGFDRITIHPRAASDTVMGSVVLQLSELHGANEVERPLYRVVREARSVARHASYTWRFTPIDGSNGRRYLLRIALRDSSPGHEVSLLATRDEHYRDGLLVSGGTAQWGDVVFSTGAEAATAFGRLERTLRGEAPPWMRSRVTLLGMLLAVDIAVGMVLWTVLRTPVPTIATGDSPAPYHRGERAYAMGGGAALAAIAGAAAWLIPLPFIHERGAVDLLGRFPEAVKRTTMRAAQDAFFYDAITSGRRMQCLIALPPSRVTWQVDVPRNGELRGVAAMRPDSWNGPGDGAQFRIGVSDGTTYIERFSRYLQPAALAADRRMVPFRIDLSKYAGRRVDVIFNTGPGEAGNAVGDAAAWCEPRIVERRR